MWIDCDPGVDDAVALILADYLYGDEIAGVSAVADPEAADIVFRSGISIVMFGLDVTLKSYLTPAEIDSLAALGTEKGRFSRAAVQIPLSIVSLITDSMR